MKMIIKEPITNLGDTIKIPAFIINDRTLTFEEIGVYMKISSMIEDGEEHITIEKLSAQSPDGKSKVRTAINGLIEKGYIIRKQTRCNGLYAANQFTLNPEKI